MCKKRKIITITVLFVLGVAVSYLQWGREIDVVGSMGTSSENFHEEHVTFTLNRLIISKLIGFLVVALIAVGLVFNAGGVKDVLLELFNKIIGA